MEWGKVFERDRASIAHAVRINGIKALRSDKGFEVSTRRNIKANPETEEPRMCALYVRYNPERDTERSK